MSRHSHPRGLAHLLLGKSICWRACQIERTFRPVGSARQSPIRRRLSFLSLAPADLTGFAPAFSVMKIWIGKCVGDQPPGEAKV